MEDSCAVPFLLPEKRLPDGPSAGAKRKKAVVPIADAPDCAARLSRTQETSQQTCCDANCPSQTALAGRSLVSGSFQETLPPAELLEGVDDALYKALVGDYDIADFLPATSVWSQHDFPTEMYGPGYTLNQQDLQQLEELFWQQQLSENWEQRVDPRSATDLAASAAQTGDCNENDKHSQRIKNIEQTGVSDITVELAQAQELFERLWNRYPVKLGREKISDRQILRIAATGEKAIRRAIVSYCKKKHRQPKKFWMYGSTFFNGGYKAYLPEQYTNLGKQAQ